MVSLYKADYSGKKILWLEEFLKSQKTEGRTKQCKSVISSGNMLHSVYDKSSEVVN